MSTVVKEIMDTLSKNRPNITSSSIKTYTSLLTNLLKKVDSNSFDTFNDTDKCIQFLSGLKSEQTIKTTLSALFVLTKNEKYKSDMVKYSEIVNKQYSEKKTKESRKQSNLTQEKIKEIYDDLKKKVATNPTYDNYNNYIIVCLTSGLFIAPRRNLDWVAMKLKNVDKDKDNYINGNNFIFNQFKTAKFATENDKKVAIPKELKTILNKWKKLNNQDYIIFQHNEKPFTSSSFTKTLSKIYGNGVGVDALRSLYLTSHFGDVAAKLQALNDTTKKMGSSSASALQYYIKEDL